MSDRVPFVKYGATIPVSRELLIDAGILPWLDMPTPFPRIVLFQRADRLARWLRATRHEASDRLSHAWSALQGVECSGGDEW